MFWHGLGIELLRGFEVTAEGDRVLLPVGAQHLLAFLALHEGGVQRGVAAERLWPDSAQYRAAANLRAALYHARHHGPGMPIEASGQWLCLSPAVRVDLRAARGTARQVVAGLSQLPSGCDDLVGDLAAELLPGWGDEWLITERERWDQLRLYALESLARQLCGAERYLAALQTALTAIDIDPVRETAHRIVVEIHLAEGNIASALRFYQQYRSFLQRELNVAPSPKMTGLVRNLLRT
ncbi:bacterial transcriptional activator domain-containing protein [Streptomyces rubellomurinus]|uniref:BTAD domain-containing putative transcriptional regulator n=1 Tax=Streptomyces sp. Y1 TaxID=3238634 RepID=A0AB39TAM2_9ACTN|nr:bacterial transcriptional activator domain-containing protein [Streptomyces rubellomurinus]